MPHVPAVVQKDAPPVRLSDDARALMAAGWLARGEHDIARLQLQNHLWMREMLETGQYKQVVEQAIKSGAHVRPTNADGDSENADSEEKSGANCARFEPRRAFFQIVGVSKDTYQRREQELRSLGDNAWLAMRQLGVPQREIRLLAEAPADIRREIKEKTAAGETTRELVDAITGKLLELAEDRAEAKKSLKSESHRAEKAEAKLADTREKLLAQIEETKSLKAELRDNRENGLRTLDEKEAQARVNRFMDLLLQARAQLEGIDFQKSPMLMGLLDQVVTEQMRLLRQIRYECLVDSGVDDPAE